MRFYGTYIVTVLASLMLCAGEGSNGASTTADSATAAAKSAQVTEAVVNRPTLGAEPPEVCAADWLNTDDPQTLSALRGKVVLIEFWATWCGPCVAGIPHLNDLQAKYRDDGLTILSLTDQTRETVEVFQKKARSPIQYTIGVGSKLRDTYGVTGVPHAFLIGRDGKLVWHGHPSSTECEARITAALEKK